MFNLFVACKTSACLARKIIITRLFCNIYGIVFHILLPQTIYQVIFEKPYSLQHVPIGIKNYFWENANRYGRFFYKNGLDNF